jgi:hypothetical protein
MGSGGIAPHIFDLGVRGEWKGQKRDLKHLDVSTDYVALEVDGLLGCNASAIRRYISEEHSTSMFMVKK